MTAIQVQQGHKYQLGGTEVLALSGGLRPRVARIEKSQFWQLGHPFHVNATDLQPLPMAYFHNQVPG
ncbi:hypothetical protein BH10PSE16_BH10PSE16_01040 [soil metagenome]